jgi:biotin transport system substrate-specific component
MTRISRPYILMWTIVGLFLTIGATFVPVSMISSPAQWLSKGITAYPSGFKCQIGAVLLVSCLGGRTAGVLTQITYVLLGLIGLKIFNDGGGIEYLWKPTFGYLLAFIPGAWVCGQLAFKQALPKEASANSSIKLTPKPQLEHLGFSCLCGLLTIHFFGIVYSVCFKIVDLQRSDNFNLLDSILSYSVYPLFSQLLLACAATLIAFVLRRVMFY